MNAENNFEQTDKLIQAFLQGRATASEIEALKSWLATSKSNREYFKLIYTIWKVDSASGMETEEIEQAYQKVSQAVFKENTDIPAFGEEERKLIPTVFLKWAAVILLSMGIGSLLTFFVQRKQSDSAGKIALNEINVPLGSKSHIILPDGSEVWLNAGSKLSYLMDYGKKQRKVNLEGEGYFKVAKIKERPFVVHTVKANIKALGTEFNVKAYPEENAIETILVEGSVVIDKIATGKSKKSQEENSIVLKPGQKVLIFKNLNVEEPVRKTATDVIKEEIAENAPELKKIGKEIDLQESNTAIETSWKDPSWVIQGESVEDVFIMLGRRFNVSIEMKNYELNKYKFSGIIQNETLEQVFDLMSLTIPMSYTIEKGKAEIGLNPKLELKYKDAYKN
jgi:ferric-dicitrate binding protein FerR (iron transport regulator)